MSRAGTKRHSSGSTGYFSGENTGFCNSLPNSEMPPDWLIEDHLIVSLRSLQLIAAQGFRQFQAQNTDKRAARSPNAICAARAELARRITPSMAQRRQGVPLLLRDDCRVGRPARRPVVPTKIAGLAAGLRSHPASQVWLFPAVFKKAQCSSQNRIVELLDFISPQPNFRPAADAILESGHKSAHNASPIFA